MKFPGNREPRIKEPSPEEGSYEIVELTADDWLEMRNLRLEALQNEPRAFGDKHEEASQRTEEEWRSLFTTGRYFCARQGGKLVGMMCLVLGTEGGGKDPQTANVYSVYVQKDARSQGIGRAILDRVIQEARSADMKALRLEVGVGQKYAKQLYENVGFTDGGLSTEKISHGSELIDKTVMTLSLQ